MPADDTWEGLYIDDHVVVHKVGAYNMTQWMQFIAMRPKVTLIDTNGESHIIRENETVKTITEEIGMKTQTAYKLRIACA